MRFPGFPRTLGAASLAALFFLAEAASGALAAEMAVVISTDTSRPEAVVQGLAKELAGHQLKEFRLGESEEGWGALADQIESTKPALVFSVGSQAAQFVRNRLRDFPAVFTSAVDSPAAGLHSSNMTGVNADLAPERRLALLKDLYPGVRRIGVVYNPANSAFTVMRSQEAAQALGLEIVAAKIDIQQDVPRAMQAIRGQIDLLWMIRDPVLLDPTSLREVLKFSLIENVPLLAFSNSVVQAGGLLAIVPLEEDMGRQAARIAKEILAGKRPGQIEPLWPERYEITLNLRTAKKIGRLEDIAINILVYAAEQKQEIRVFR
ncbi:MAG: ABC transporter substrate-binding protein [Bdellovibrionota bacterium]